jgi:hypothetical protein
MAVLVMGINSGGDGESGEIRPAVLDDATDVAVDVCRGIGVRDTSAVVV